MDLSKDFDLAIKENNKIKQESKDKDNELKCKKR